jgi:hypothetical protein
MRRAGHHPEVRRLGIELPERTRPSQFVHLAHDVGELGVGHERPASVSHTSILRLRVRRCNRDIGNLSLA